jgi:hypothetical protein
LTGHYDWKLVLYEGNVMFAPPLPHTSIRSRPSAFFAKPCGVPDSSRWDPPRPTHDRLFPEEVCKKRTFSAHRVDAPEALGGIGHRRHHGWHSDRRTDRDFCG